MVYVISVKSRAPSGQGLLFTNVESDMLDDELTIGRSQVGYQSPEEYEKLCV